MGWARKITHFRTATPFAGWQTNKSVRSCKRTTRPLYLRTQMVLWLPWFPVRRVSPRLQLHPPLSRPKRRQVTHRVRGLEYGTRHTAHGTRHTAHGTRHTAHGAVCDHAPRHSACIIHADQDISSISQWSPVLPPRAHICAKGTQEFARAIFRSQPRSSITPADALSVQGRAVVGGSSGTAARELPAS